MHQPTSAIECDPRALPRIDQNPNARAERGDAVSVARTSPRGCPRGLLRRETRPSRGDPTGVHRIRGLVGFRRRGAAAGDFSRVRRETPTLFARTPLFVSSWFYRMENPAFPVIAPPGRARLSPSEDPCRPLTFYEPIGVGAIKPL